MAYIDHSAKIARLALDLLESLSNAKQITITINGEDGVSFEASDAAWGIAGDMPREIAKNYIQGELDPYVEKEPF